MSDIINIKEKVAERNFDLVNEPCSLCDDKPQCKTTCEEARMWWQVFAKRFRGN